jgi:hypothetical protein
VRRTIVQALKTGNPLGIKLEVEPGLERELVNDGSGDLLDAAICAVQAAWGWKRRDANFGLPAGTVPDEGWIVTA